MTIHDSPRPAGRPCWFDLDTPDSDVAKAFYSELLGATAKSVEGAPTTYYMLEQGDQTIAGIMQMNDQWQGAPPHWMPYFNVNDTDAAAQAAAEAGGGVSVQSFDTPHGRIAVIDDPFGAVFSVVQMRAAR